VLSESIPTLRQGAEGVIDHYGIGLAYEGEALHPEAIHEFSLAARTPGSSTASSNECVARWWA